MKTAIRDQVDHLDVVAYFTYLAQLMKTNPPSAEDAPMVASMAKIGLVPGQDFDPSKLGAFDKEAIKAVPKLAQVKIMEYFKKALEPINGWAFITKNVGIYGTDYLAAGVNHRHRSGRQPAPGCDLSDWRKRTGAATTLMPLRKSTSMHFDKGQMPPVNGFWSITMYDKDYFFVPNSLNRYTLSARNKFITNADGSVDLYFQADSPGKAKEANWLPAPKAKFIPMMRLYWPKETPPSIIDGTWKPPAINEAK